MRRSIATVSLSGTLEEKLSAAAEVGFDGVEIFENDLIASPLAPREIRALAGELGLTIDLYQPFRDFEGVDDTRLAANLRRAEAKFALMVELGVDTLLVCSNATPSAIGDDARSATQLRALAETAEPYGVRVAYEALAWGSHVSTYGHSWRIVEAADHPSLGVCLDSFHILSRDDDPAGIRDIPAEKIFFLQLADAPRMDMNVLQWSRHHRCFPGQGGFDLTAFTDHVIAAGYRGPLSLEVFNDVFRASDPDRTAADALRSLSALEDAVARTREAPEQGGGAASPDAGNASVRLKRLPDLVPAEGLGFVEVAADDPASARTRAVLSALGFAHTRDHRSKPVELWEHGRTRILLNSADPRLGHTWSGDAAVTALGVDVADPEQVAARAERLSAPALSRRRDPSEARLRAVAAPDGTAVFLCPPGSAGGADWTEDFSAPAVDHRREGAPTPITGIDHIGLHQPFDHFDEASLFYQALFGLSPSENTDLASPDGLVRSRVLTRPGPEPGPRIALNVSVLGRGPQADAAGGAQHIALACDDIVAVARAMAAAGEPPIRVSDNYYDDLAARTGLSPARCELMRGLGLLYDSDGAGEFLHLYSPLLDGRLFFEVVQRIDGYEGYGAVNTHVRMAAHRAERRAEHRAERGA
ncbi:sugar phosphate isomerase/epimerase and 4-hydroxyphenylpyruvate domain-containing protein [Nocardiopsis ganjiahuensis]|uniref:sugar phosphate isomerase/epimerase and 4-hydroxyphenylpyruvate domain-containing protein n=1 Tax=Nocardiopsis ganjiahuensis TaxID=239984 RepID=UPI000347892E|nr:sugar phosphate isomerase/epimerase and 4-hydroxyphenylpyruvate domain-containing protein [Nocardiopsis ganjiahuensis]